MLQQVLQLLTWPMRLGFERELQNPVRYQERILSQLTGALARSEYGAHLGVTGPIDYLEFSKRIPISSYDELEPWLLRESADFFQTTSGSSGNSKQIPYTSGLRSSFNRMFLLWMGDWLSGNRRLESYRIFASVSPGLNETDGAINEDTDYVAKWFAPIIKKFLLDTTRIKASKNTHEFYEALSEVLLNEPNLEIISIWSPSYLISWMQWVESRQGAKDWTKVWPKLKLVSAWADASAAPIAEILKQKLPHAEFQPKGLLATEAPLSMPWSKAQGSVPMPSEVFYEFMDQNGEVSLLHQLQQGQQYELVITQKGGLYRYKMGDLVVVTGKYKATPVLKFVGRASGVCDLVGEKLNAAFVSQNLAPGAMLIPDVGSSRYIYLGAAKDEQLEARLSQNPHYKTALKNGQLRNHGWLNIQDVQGAWMEFCTKKGMRMGDIKPVSLITDAERATEFLKFARDKSQHKVQSDRL